MFLFKQKDYVSCERLEKGIHFDYNGLYYCCFFSHSNMNYVPIVKKINDTYKTLKMVEKVRKQDIKILRSGKIPLRCQGCSQLKLKDWEDSSKIKYLSLTPNQKCNSDCIYCTTHRNKKYLNSLPDMKIYDILEHLVKKNQIHSNCEIHIGGGEPTLHCEFSKIIDLFIENLKPQLKIYSSGILYSETIEKALKSGCCILSVSVDSGNSELYKQIKNVDKFDKVVQNLTKYANSLPPNERILYIEMKYILLPNVNDTKEAILEFLELVKKVGNPSVRFDIDWNWLKSYKNDIKKRGEIFKTLKFVESECQKKSLSFCFYCEPKLLIEKYKDEYDSIIVDC